MLRSKQNPRQTQLAMVGWSPDIENAKTGVK